MRGAFASMIGTILIFCVLALIMRNQVMNLLYLSAMAFFFGIYLVVDTQLVMGNNKYELNDEDYILGALILYIDII